MSDKTKKQFINEYFDLKEAFLKEKEVNFINHEPLDFEFKLADLMGDIEEAYNLNTTKKYNKWCEQNIEFPYFHPLFD